MFGSLRSRILRGVAALGLAAAVLGTGGAAFADTLKGAMLKAYRTNPSMQAARARQRGDDESVPRAKSGWRPVINARGTVSKTWSESETPPIPESESEVVAKNLSIQLSQPLFRGFKTVEGIKQAEAAVAAGQQQLLITEQQLLLQVADAYFSVIRDRSILALRQRNVGNLQKQVRAANARFEAGEVTRTDVTQARARVSGAMASVASAKANLASSMARYENAVGSPPGKLSSAGLAKVPRTLEEALAIARQTNPQILAAEQARIASAHGIKVTQGDLLPEASLNAQAEISDTDRNGTETTTKSATIQGVLNVPIYEAGRVYSAVREAKQLESQRQLEVVVAGRAVRQGVKAAWSDMISAREAIDAAEAQVYSAQLSLDGVTQEYLVGSRSTIDVLNAEQEVLNARINLVNAQYSHVVSSYELVAAIGRLTARRLALGGPYYDPDDHYHQVKDKWIGLEADTLQ